jgi:Fe-Mn family superoxide dismutase
VIASAVVGIANALDRRPESQSVLQVDINKAIGSDKIPDDIATAVRNNGGGHWNHSFFWKVMTGPTNSNGPSEELKTAVDASFGSLDELKAKFNAAAAGR